MSKNSENGKNNRVEYSKTFLKINHKLGVFSSLPLDSWLSFESGGVKGFFLELIDQYRASVQPRPFPGRDPGNEVGFCLFFFLFS